MTMSPGAAAHLTIVAAQIPETILFLSSHLMLEGATVERAAGDPNLLAVWAEVEPEARSGVLMSLAWGTRGGILYDGSGHAGAYASDLFGYAGAAPDDATFFGPRYPAMPAAGQAGALSSSLAFDRDDLAISLKTALILSASTPRAAGVGDQ